MQERDIEDLIPHKNARRVNESRVQFFMQMPIEDIDPIGVTWKGEVVDGIQRLEALKRKGALTIFCELATDEDEAGGGLDVQDRE